MAMGSTKSTSEVHGIVVVYDLSDVEEVWFVGFHTDVGGGSVKNKTPNSLARIPLRWMVRECFKTRTGIMFESKGLRAIGLDPSTLSIPRRQTQAAAPCGFGVISRDTQETLIDSRLAFPAQVGAAPSGVPSAESGSVPVGSTLGFSLNV